MNFLKVREYLKNHPYFKGESEDFVYHFERPNGGSRYTIILHEDRKRSDLSPLSLSGTGNLDVYALPTWVRELYYEANECVFKDCGEYKTRMLVSNRHRRGWENIIWFMGVLEFPEIASRLNKTRNFGRSINKCVLIPRNHQSLLKPKNIEDFTKKAIERVRAEGYVIVLTEKDGDILFEVIE